MHMVDARDGETIADEEEAIALGDAEGADVFA